MEDRPSRKQFKARLELMVRELRQDILSGKYLPGTPLPSEVVLVEQYALSNNSVRKGLDLLVQEGLIIKKHRIGSIVANPQQSKITITLGCSPSIERDISLSRILEMFHKAHPAIQVNAVTITSPDSFNYLKTAQTYLEHGIIDVMTINNINFQEISEHDCTHLFEPLMPQINMYPFLNETFTYEGQLFVQPLAFSPTVLAFNKSHFREAGLLEPDSSWTWDYLIRMAKKLTSEDRHALFFHVLSENRWPVFLLQSGISMADSASGNKAFINPELLDSIQLMRQLINDRDVFAPYLSSHSNDAEKLMRQGKISMTVQNYFSMNEFKNTDIEYDISPLPFMHTPTTLTHIIGMGVNRKSAVKDAAKILVRYFASKQAQQAIRDLTLSIPGIKPIAETAPSSNSRLNRPASYSLFKEIIPTFRTHRDLGLTVRGFKKMGDILKLFLSGMMDKPALCRMMEDELQGELISAVSLKKLHLNE